MNIASPSLVAPQTRAFEIETRDPIPTSREEMMAAYRAAHPRLTPAEAFASNVEMAPPNSDNPRASNHISKLHTEIKVNGKAIARVYNGGAMEIANEYGFLSDELNFGDDKIVGPDLAEDRVKRIKAALVAHGVLPKDDLTPTTLMTATLSNTPILESLRADTAQTQEQWVADRAKEGPLDPGMLFSRVA
jgi:hypothetical protein